MEDIDHLYSNDRYLAFMTPWALQQVVGRYFQRWFKAHRCSEDIDPEFADIDFPDEITHRVRRTRKAIVALSRLARCWITAPAATTLPSNVQSRTVELLLALRAFLRDAQDGWNDVRHCCYQVLASNCKLEEPPSTSDQWDLLERLSISQARNDNQDVLRIRYKNEDWDVYVSRKYTTKELSSIRIRGWFNDSRRRLAEASDRFAASLGPMHSQLFILGGLLANVTWGNSWWGAAVRPGLPTSITGTLPDRLGPLLRELSFLIPDQVAQLRTTISSASVTSTAISTAEEIRDTIAQFIYRRVHNGIFDPPAERTLLAYDLCRCQVTTGTRCSIANDLAALYQSYFRKNVRPFDSDDELRTVAEGYRPIDTLLVGLNVKQASRSTLPIWERISLQQSGNDPVRIELDGCNIGEVNVNAGSFLRVLIEQQGRPISGTELVNSHGLPHNVVGRYVVCLPGAIQRHINSTPGRGTHLTNEQVDK